MEALLPVDGRVSVVLRPGYELIVDFLGLFLDFAAFGLGTASPHICFNIKSNRRGDRTNLNSVII